MPDEQDATEAVTEETPTRNADAFSTARIEHEPIEFPADPGDPPDDAPTNTDGEQDLGE